MLDGHPLVWLWLVSLTVAVAAGSTDILTPGALAGSLVLTGVLLALIPVVLAALAGPLAPAFGWLCCAGEGVVEAAALRRQRRRVGGLTGWLTIVDALATGVPGGDPRRLLRWLPADLLQGLAAAAITAALLFQDRLGAQMVAASFALIPLSVAAPLLLPRRAVAHA